MYGKQCAGWKKAYHTWGDGWCKQLEDYEAIECGECSGERRAATAPRCVRLAHSCPPAAARRARATPRRAHLLTLQPATRALLLPLPLPLPRRRQRNSQSLCSSPKPQ